MQPAALELLSALAQALEPLGSPWYVFGAQAVVVYGQPRMTADVDVTVQLGTHDTQHMVATLEKHGFSLRVPDVDGFVRNTRVLPLVHMPTEMPLDMVLAGPGLEELFFERIQHIEVGATKIPVISPEDLVTTKILAGRSKDLDDVYGVLVEQADHLDIEHIQTMLRTIELALDRSDLLQELTKLLQRAKMVVSNTVPR